MEYLFQLLKKEMTFCCLYNVLRLALITPVLFVQFYSFIVRFQKSLEKTILFVRWFLRCLFTKNEPLSQFLQFLCM